MNAVKRERWTEADIDALPVGEHDFFDRKSGQLFANKEALQAALAKALSAFANSGGGHLILGVDDTGKPDGVPRAEGRTSVRDWLEQKIPHLVEYALSDFRVHVVERAASSRVPADRDVVVIDVGDSALAPHQCNFGGVEARKYVYYHRRGGRSEPAPHFYLELLRQRLVSPVLEAKFVGVSPENIKRTSGGIFLAMGLRFSVENIGRVAAYKWRLQITERSGHPDPRVNDYHFSARNFPPGLSWSRGLRLDDTILPGCSLEENQDFGLLLRPQSETGEALQVEIANLLADLTLGYRLATETSPGDLQRAELRSSLDTEALAAFVLDRLKGA